MDSYETGVPGGIFDYLPPLANLAFDIHREFVVRISHVMTESLGEKEAEAALRQEWEHIGYAVPLNIVRDMDLRERGFLVAGFCNNWADVLLGERQVTEVTALGTRARVNSCPFSKAAYAFCWSHLGISVAKLCEFLAPGHEAVSRCYLSKGDDHCEILIKSETAKADELWRAPVLASILPPPLNTEERMLWSHSYFAGSWISQVKALVEVLGSDRALDLLRPAIRQIGTEMAPRVRKELRIIVSDPRSVAQGLSSLNSAFLMEGGIIEDAVNGIQRATTTCPMSGEPLEVCIMFQSFYDGLVGALNPRMHLEFAERMGEGGGACHWTLITKQEAEPKQEARGAITDPYAALSLRYVHGEISDEEYEKKMAMLKKHHPGPSSR